MFFTIFIHLFFDDPSTFLFFLVHRCKEGRAICESAARFQLAGPQYLDAQLLLYPVCDAGHRRLLAIKLQERTIGYVDSLGLNGSHNDFPDTVSVYSSRHIHRYPYRYSSNHTHYNNAGTLSSCCTTHILSGSLPSDPLVARQRLLTGCASFLFLCSSL
ncbi:hypothetical protein T440DRAFT_159084 [Plenodomus tracheiphilus IPT5]|uniref:Uncharacterized protein n=1 Tax=Plenodomus tracheiphilus IPT5 TaxID=1408161 RepID=A0A6A7BM84_9PLEO|nr:hypothetical protein T440DRAFT_159084 [Plenodomus tracheiphilus IPT5]